MKELELTPKERAILDDLAEKKAEYQKLYDSKPLEAGVRDVKVDVTTTNEDLLKKLDAIKKQEEIENYIKNRMKVKAKIE